MVGCNSLNRILQAARYYYSYYKNGPAHTLIHILPLLLGLTLQLVPLLVTFTVDKLKSAGVVLKS